MISDTGDPLGARVRQGSKPDVVVCPQLQALIDSKISQEEQKAARNRIDLAWKLWSWMGKNNLGVDDVASMAQISSYEVSMALAGDAGDEIAKRLIVIMPHALMK